MKKLAVLAVFAVILASVVSAAPHKVAVLDGTSWKLDVEPDGMTKGEGEKQFKETLTFADGSVTLSAPKVGFWASPYTVSKKGKKSWGFNAERTSMGEGTSVWTGTVHKKNIEGRLIWTNSDGEVLSYTFKGKKLD